MKCSNDEGYRELLVLDRYLSLRAGEVFEDVAPAGIRRVPPPLTCPRRPLRSAAVLFLAAGAAFVLTMLGQAGTGRVAIPSLRGLPAQLEGVSSWRGSAALELAWSAVPGATQYSLQVWDFHGALIESRIVDGAESVVTVVVRSDAPRPLLWTVVAWEDTRRLAGSEVLTSLPIR